MITTKLLDLRDKEVERNLKLIELEIKEVRMFDNPDPKLVRIEKNFPINFKES